MRKIQKPKKEKVLITAGPTIEKIDPVRYISNYSSGTMGYAIAEEMKNKGFEVVLISGPVQMSPLKGVRTINVETAEEMNNAVRRYLKGSRCFIASAAVSDFKVKETKHSKIKKKNELTIKLVKNVDILAKIGKRKDLIKIGFALETEKGIKNSRKKLKDKDLEFIVLNILSTVKNPFGENLDKNGKIIKREYDILYKNGNKKKYKNVSKITMAKKIAYEAIKYIKTNETK